MSKDLITSYDNSSGYTQQFSHHSSGKGLSNQPAFSKDVLEAIEKGDMETAMRLLQQERGLSNPHSQVTVVFANLIKGLEALLQQIYLLTAKKKLEKKDKHTVQNALNVQLGKKSTTDELRIIIENGRESARTMIEKFTSFVRYLDSKGKEYAKLGFFEGKALAWQGLNLLNERMIEPASQWLENRLDETLDILKAQLNRLDVATKPFRKKAADITAQWGRLILHGVRTAQEVTVRRVHFIADPIIEKSKEALEMAQKKIKKVQKQLSDAAEQVKEKVDAVAQPIIQFIQNIPAIMAPFAFWLVKQMEIPVNGIRENIRRWVNNTKKAIGWLGDKGGRAFKQCKKVAVAVAKKVKVLADWIERKIVPAFFRFIAWFYKECLLMAEIIIKAALKLAKFIKKGLIAIVMYFWEGVPDKTKSRLKFMLQKLPKFRL